MGCTNSSTRIESSEEGLERRSTLRHDADDNSEIPKDLYFDLLAAAEAARERGVHTEVYGPGGRRLLRLTRGAHRLSTDESRPGVGDLVQVVALKPNGAHHGRKFLGGIGKVVKDAMDEQPFQIQGMGPRWFHEEEVDLVEQSEKGEMSRSSTACPSTEASEPLSPWHSGADDLACV